MRGARSAGIRRLLTAAALISTLAAGRAEAFNLCEVAAAAGERLPRAAGDDPGAQTARDVWRRVYRGFYATTARQTELFVIARGFAPEGRPLPPYAAICQTEGPPRLYLTYGLLELLGERRVFDEDFIALILGHELGHRLRDFDRAGRWTAEGWEPKMEEIADAHGAFLAAASGFSTRQLACDDAMDLFLAVEAGVDDSARQGRKARLAQVLAAFDVYESLYDAAAALLFTDDRVATELLSWVNAQMIDQAEPLGEFFVLEALARMSGAIDETPWQRMVSVPDAPTGHLRCAPVYPAHTAFWDEAIEGHARGPTRRGVHAQLRRAERLLKKAALLGASELIVSSSLACVRFYAGRFAKAERALSDARAALPADAPQAVRAALDANGALIAWARWLQDHRPPAADAAPAERRAWGAALRRAAGPFRANPQLAAWLDRLRAYPKVTARRARPEGPLEAICGGRAPKTGAGPSRMPPLAAIPPSGGCPCGWSELHLLRSRVAEGSVRTCAPAGWAVGMRWVHLLLPDAGVDRRLLLHDALRGPLESLATWERGCDKLVTRGVSDRGSHVIAGRCGRLGAEEAILLTDAQCRVSRAVVVGPQR